MSLIRGWTGGLTSAWTGTPPTQLPTTGAHQIGIPYVPTRGLYMLDRGERVTPAVGNKPHAGITPISIVQYIGSINSQVDMESANRDLYRKFLDKINEQW